MVLGQKHSGSGIRFFRKSFSLKPSPDQYGANKKKFSQIGPAVPELLRDTQTHTQTDMHTYKNPYYFVVLIVKKWCTNQKHFLSALNPSINTITS